MSPTQERPAWRVSPFVMALVAACLLAIAIFSFKSHQAGGWLPASVLFLLVARGFLVVQPNDSRVLTFFGRYAGSVSLSGWHWSNPFTIRRVISRRVRNFTSDTLKVNDAAGNPVEIAAVVVWRVADTAQALFDVEDYVSFVATQAETALRTLAGTFPYQAEGDHVTLLGNHEAVADYLMQQLTDRVGIAGVHVMEARLAHLAYAPEIAQTMLRRQQAEAVVAARQIIVDGALGMVQMALDKLLHRGVLELDEERKATMVSNLMVVLVSDQPAQPVVNAGTLYG